MLEFPCDAQDFLGTCRSGLPEFSHSDCCCNHRQRASERRRNPGRECCRECRDNSVSSSHGIYGPGNLQRGNFLSSVAVKKQKPESASCNEDGLSELSE